MASITSIDDLPHIYNISVNKFRNLHEREGLRKFALLNNFLYTKFEAQEQEPSEEEVMKREEENWLDACLDSLDEEENGYVYIKLMAKDDAMELEEQDSDIQITEDIIIPEDLLHLPYFVPDTDHMAIDEEETLAETYETVETDLEEPELNEDINMIDYPEFFDTSSETGRSFHPYWKDNSIIASPPSVDFYRPFSNFNGVPRLFQKYRLGRDDFIVKPLDSRAVLGLLDHECQPPSHLLTNKRSKDDLDILCSLTPRDLDQSALMDVISMLECRGEKKNNDPKKNLPLSSLEDDKIWFIR